MTRFLPGAAGLIAAVALAPTADAAVVSTSSADRVARAIVQFPDQLRDARWVRRPDERRSAAVSSSKLAGFPRAGRTFGVLSSGSPTALDNANSSAGLSTDLGGGVYRGTRDTTILRVDLRVPRGARCLSFSFRFLSEEYDEFVDSEFNDAFIAELGKSSWDSPSGSAIVEAPHNFAFDRENKLITVNSTGDFSVTADRARGTTYDAGTRRLRASRRVSPGTVRVYFSIFDQGDRQYDSTVLIDKLVADRRRPCNSGAALD